MTCNMCGQQKEFAHLVIKKYTYWRVELRCEQVFLGSCFIILNRHLEDIIDISKAEREELFIITKKLRDSIKKAFKPDKFNYASLGNITSHVHLQVIPRYATDKTFSDITFKDKQWGKHMILKDKSFIVSNEVMEKVKEKIKNNL